MTTATIPHTANFFQQPTHAHTADMRTRYWEYPGQGKDIALGAGLIAALIGHKIIRWTTCSIWNLALLVAWILGLAVTILTLAWLFRRDHKHRHANVQQTCSLFSRYQHKLADNIRW